MLSTNWLTTSDPSAEIEFFLYHRKHEHYLLKGDEDCAIQLCLGFQLAKTDIFQNLFQSRNLYKGHKCLAVMVQKYTIHASK